MSKKNNKNNNNRPDIFERGDVGVKPKTPGTSKPDYTKPAPKKHEVKKYD